jgi:hypothetical protein
MGDLPHRFRQIRLRSRQRDIGVGWVDAYQESTLADILRSIRSNSGHSAAHLWRDADQIPLDVRILRLDVVLTVEKVIRQRGATDEHQAGAEYPRETPPARRSALLLLPLPWGLLARCLRL